LKDVQLSGKGPDDDGPQNQGRCVGTAVGNLRFTHKQCVLLSGTCESQQAGFVFAAANHSSGARLFAVSPRNIGRLFSDLQWTASDAYLRRRRLPTAAMKRRAGPKTHRAICPPKAGRSCHTVIVKNCAKPRRRRLHAPQIPPPALRCSKRSSPLAKNSSISRPADSGSQVYYKVMSKLAWRVRCPMTTPAPPAPLHCPSVGFSCLIQQTKKHLWAHGAPHKGRMERFPRRRQKWPHHVGPPGAIGPRPLWTGTPAPATAR